MKKMPLNCISNIMKSLLEKVQLTTQVNSNKEHWSQACPSTSIYDCDLNNVTNKSILIINGQIIAEGEGKKPTICGLICVYLYFMFSNITEESPKS